MSEHALEDLNKFLLLAKTTKGAATAALIREVLEHPNVYVFGELLALPNVQELEGTSSAPIFELLKLFTYGSWADFKAAPPAGETLSAAQERKLKKLTVVSLASQNKKLSYEVLLTELEMRSVREVEDLLIECIYGGLLHGRLDQAARQMDVFSCAARDVHPRELDAMSDALSQWHEGAVSLMASLSTQLGRFKTHADEARAAQASLDASIEAAKATLRSNPDGADGFGPSDSEARMDFDADEKTRKSGRLKTRHPGGSASKHTVVHSR